MQHGDFSIEDYELSEIKVHGETLVRLDMWRTTVHFLVYYEVTPDGLHPVTRAVSQDATGPLGEDGMVVANRLVEQAGYNLPDAIE